MMRVALDERSLARMAGYIADLGVEEAERQSHTLAVRAAQLMEDVYPEVLVTYGLVAKPLIGKNRRSVEERGLVKLKDAMQGKAVKKGIGWEASLEVRDDLTPADRAKVFAIFSGSKPHPIPREGGSLTKKAMTGWERGGVQVFAKKVNHPGSWARSGMLRLVRDRVYQRIRRGSV